MLFNSLAFLFVFLPVAAAGFYAIGRCGSRTLLFAWLAGVSLVFYALWKPGYVVLLVGSITANYVIANKMIPSLTSVAGRRVWTAVGIALNLALLAYFKYTMFFLGALGDLGLATWRVSDIILPLAISFFTFQQISYLVGAYRGEPRAGSWVEYAFFVSFFPQLIAGPIVRFSEVKAQYDAPAFGRFATGLFAMGVTVFVIGLAKKVLLADGFAAVATPVFEANASGEALTLYRAWLGAIAYSFQILFDFSGYSDMAIGLGLMFGLRLPENFNAPYRARSIVDFWRRWHMTLSRFLRDYLYIPLGGGRAGRSRQFTNVMIVMLLGGLWHGAGWNFVLWGGMHGALIVATHWACSRPDLARFAPPPGMAVAITFILAAFTWVMFRVGSPGEFMSMASAMAGLSGLGAPLGQALQDIAFLGAATAIVLIVMHRAPTTGELMARWEREGLRMGEHVALPWACGTAVSVCAASIFMGRYSEFIYFQF